GSGNSVRRLGAQLELGELDSVRLARDLVESGVVAVTEPPADVRPIEPGAVEEAGEPVAAEVAGEPAGSEEHAQPAESGEEYEPVVPGSLSGGWQEYHGWDHAGPVSQDGERAVEQPAETSPWAQAGQLVPAEPGAVPPVPGS